MTSTLVPARDGARLNVQFMRVKGFMLDGEFHTLSEISQALGYPEASVSARLRQMRGEGYIVDRVFVRRGLHKYRVRVPEPEQLALV